MLLKKTLFSLLIANCLLLVINAQSQFQYAIGGTSAEYAHSIIQTTDGGYAAAGETNSFGAGSIDMYVVKLDASGLLIWSRTVGGINLERAYSIIQTTDGGFAVVGGTNSVGAGSNDIYLVKFDAGGSLEWSKAIGSTDDDVGRYVVQSTDGGYVIAGGTNSSGAGNYDMLIIKLDVGGSLQWSKTIGGTGLEYAHSITRDSDGGYAVAGYTHSFGAGGRDMIIVKLDAGGTLQWTKTIGGTGGEAAWCIIQTTDGGYAVGGSSNSFGSGNADFFCVKLYPSGILQWSKTVETGATLVEVAQSIIQTTDGGYAMAGHTKSTTVLPDMQIAKLDSAGMLQWNKTVGGTNRDSTHSIIQTPDGGFLLAGSTTSFGAGGHDMYIVKLDTGGITCGNSTSPSSTLNSPTPTVTDPPVVVMTPSPVVTVSTPTLGSGGTVTVVCNVVPVELTSFNVNINGNNVELSWSTATELNNLGFEVQRRREEKEFSTIGFVEGKGTTTETQFYYYIDEGIDDGKYQYRLKQIDFDGTFEYSQIVELEVTSPNEFALMQNYPNPFNPSTKISYSLPTAEFVTLKVIDVLGKEVLTLVSEEKAEGTYEIDFNASELPSGIYFYRLQAGNYIEMKKMILLK